MQRRDFLKGACRICLLGAAATAVAVDISSCTPKIAGGGFRPAVNNNQVEVPLSLFDHNSFLVISPAKYAYEISVEKQPGNEFKALLLRCTHYQNQLTATGNGFTCSLHGSRFDKEGNVIKGPAEIPLQQLKTEIIKDMLLIQL